MIAAWVRVLAWAAFVVFCFWYAATTLVTNRNPILPPPPISGPASSVPPLPGPKAAPASKKKTPVKKSPVVLKSKRGLPVVSVKKKEDLPSAFLGFISREPFPFPSRASDAP